MDISFHYYTVKVLASAAGFHECEAQIIAANSQFVDDYDWLTEAAFSTDLPAYCAEFSKEKVLYPVTTGFVGYIDMAALCRWKNQIGTCIPFHFMPQSQLQITQMDQVVDYRTVPAELSDTSVISRLLRNARADYLEDSSVRGTGYGNDVLIYIGILLHVFADTYAHQNFSGFMHHNNYCHITEVVDLLTTEDITESLNLGFYEKLPGLGHTEAGHIPDATFASFQMSYSQTLVETSKDKYTGHYKRNNAAVFLNVAKQIYLYLSSLHHGGTPYTEGWTDELAYRLWSVFVHSDRSESDIASCWSYYFRNINFHYAKKEMFPTKSGLKYQFKEAFFLFNYYAKRVRDAAISLNLPALQSDRDFYYNTSAEMKNEESSLEFYVYPPAAIHTSAAGQATSPDSVLFFIINNTDQGIELLNTKKIAHVTEVPAIHDMESEPDLTRFFISFNWGGGIRNFADVTAFKEMEIEVEGDMGTQFYVWKNDVENPYFVIVPIDDCKLKPRENIQIRIHNIQSHAMLGYADIIVTGINIDNGFHQNTFEERLRIDKIATVFEIVNFTADDYTIGKNRRTTLRWKVTGAERCEINPGQYQVDSIGMKEISVEDTTTFSLTAKCDEKEENQMINVYVGEQSIEFFKAETEEAIESMSEKRLLWNTLYAESISIVTDKGENIDISQRNIDCDSVVVTPHDDTVYTLTCTGAKAALLQEVAVKVNSVKILDFTGKSTLGVGDNVDVVWDEAQEAGIRLAWFAERVEWASLTDVEGNITYDISQEMLNKGEMYVKPSHLCTHYVLECGGGNGPAEKTVTVNIIDMVNIVNVSSRAWQQGFYDYFHAEWDVRNATSVKVERNGHVISTEAKGSYDTREYNYLSGQLNGGGVTVTAEGKGGPVVKQDEVRRQFIKQVKN